MTARWEISNLNVKIPKAKSVTWRYHCELHPHACAHHGICNPDVRYEAFVKDLGESWVDDLKNAYAV